MTVLYPGVPVPEMLPAPVLRDSEIVLLSVSRFDPRKNLPLAIDALRELRSRVPADLFSRVQLVLAGHHNLRLPEDVALVSALRRQAADTGLSDHVQLVFSPSEEERRALVARCRAVLYTPTAEHFGYVPVEAMAAGRPVVAVNNGGPTETVLHNMTGMLCAPTPIAFGQALATLVQQPDVADSMGRAGYAHVKAHFSLEAFGDTLETLLSGLVQAHHRSRQ
ncbi:MAG: glycosyltransferase [Vicinamibacterales bacterium]